MARRGRRARSREGRRRISSRGAPEAAPCRGDVVRRAACLLLRRQRLPRDAVSEEAAQGSRRLGDPWRRQLARLQLSRRRPQLLRQKTPWRARWRKQSLRHTPRALIAVAASHGNDSFLAFGLARRALLSRQRLRLGAGVWEAAAQAPCHLLLVGSTRRAETNGGRHASGCTRASAERVYGILSSSSSL